MSDLAEPIRAALRQKRGNGSEMSQAIETGVSVSAFHDFMAGGRLGLTMWRRLYRQHPELRWLLEDYNRRLALGGEATSAHEPEPAEVATGPPRTR